MNLRQLKLLNPAFIKNIKLPQDGYCGLSLFNDTDIFDGDISNRKSFSQWTQNHELNSRTIPVQPTTMLYRFHACHKSPVLPGYAFKNWSMLSSFQQSRSAYSTKYQTSKSPKEKIIIPSEDPQVKQDRHDELIWGINKILDANAVNNKWSIQLSNENTFLSWCRNAYIILGVAATVFIQPLPLQHGIEIACFLVVLSWLKLICGTGLYVKNVILLRNHFQTSLLEVVSHCAFAIVHLLLFLYVTSEYLGAAGEGLIDEEPDNT